MIRLRAHIALAVTCVSIACGGEGPDSGTSADAPARRTAASPPVMGTLELADTTLAFRVTKCDLTGTAEDGMLLLGTGTMPDGSSLLPDGRTMLVEVERLSPHLAGAASVYERATVQFGSFMDEDGWEATATSFDGSRWTSDTDLMEWWVPAELQRLLIRL